MKPLIHLDQVSRIYRKVQPVYALNGVSFSIAPGEAAAIVGRSGSGKSTLLNLIGGLDKASSGSLIINGKNLAQMSRTQLTQYRRHDVGMIFQSFHLIPKRTAIQNIELALMFNGTPRLKRRGIAEELLVRTGLQDRMHHYPGELSGGEQQRVAIARALANKPALLLADEPTGNLDSRTAEEIMALLREIHSKENTTLLIVTHDEEIAGEICTRVIRLLDGRVVEDKKSD